ncbi:MAG: hypothetical protein AAFU70_06925 [Planctomycetota bacterium]
MTRSTRDTNRPYIAVVGGFWDLDEKDPDQGRRARAEAREIGACLAKRGLGLIVYFSDDRSLEPHVVAGYAEAADADNKGAIRVVYPTRQNVRFPAQNDPETRDLFTDCAKPVQQWSGVYYRSIVGDDDDGETVDGVFLLAGGRTTLITGYLAHARDLPMLAVDAFGGSVEDLRAALPDRIERWSTRDRDPHVEAFHKRCLDRMAAERERERRAAANAVAASRERKLAWLRGLFALLFAVASVSLAWIDMPKQVFIAALFLAMPLSGATGGLISAVMWETEGRAAGYSALMGAIAAFATGLAYLLPLFLSSASLLDPLEAPSIADRTTLGAVVLLTLSAGMGFETVLSRLRAEAERAPVTTERRE